MSHDLSPVGARRRCIPRQPRSVASNPRTRRAGTMCGCTASGRTRARSLSSLSRPCVVGAKIGVSSPPASAIARAYHAGAAVEKATTRRQPRVPAWRAISSIYNSTGPCCSGSCRRSARPSAVGQGDSSQNPEAGPRSAPDGFHPLPLASQSIPWPSRSRSLASCGPREPRGPDSLRPDHACGNQTPSPAECARGPWCAPATIEFNDSSLAVASA